MKKTLTIMLIAICSFGLAVAQQSETRNLPEFSKVNLSGNLEVHLVKSNRHGIKIETEKNDDLDNYTTEVRNETLYFSHRKKHKNEDSPKVTLLLEHSGIVDFDLSGIVSLFSEDTLPQNDLLIRGEGIIKGEIDVAVRKLEIILSGISNMKVSGTADSAKLKIDGMGKINAKNLKVDKVRSSSGGFARVKVGP